MSEQEPLPGAVTLQHGDRVLICVSQGIDRAEHHQWVIDNLRERFPGVEFTIAGDVTGVLVQRGEAEEGTWTT